MKKYLTLAILIFIITNFIRASLYDKETTSCITTKPNHDADCYMRNQNYTTLACCSINLTYPEQNNLCIAMPLNAKGLSGVVDNVLVPNITISGLYNCSGNAIALTSILYVVFMFIIY